MAHFTDFLNHFSLRVTDTDEVVESLFDRHKNVLVNGGGKHAAAVFSEIGWEICSAAEEAYSERGLDDDQTLTSLSLKYSTVRRSPSSSGTDASQPSSRFAFSAERKILPRFP